MGAKNREGRVKWKYVLKGTCQEKNTEAIIVFLLKMLMGSIV